MSSASPSTGGIAIVHVDLQRCERQRFREWGQDHEWSAMMRSINELSAAVRSVRGSVHWVMHLCSTKRPQVSARGADMRMMVQDFFSTSSPTCHFEAAQHELSDDCPVEADDRCHSKAKADAFTSPLLAEATSGSDAVIVTGVMTNDCVMRTIEGGRRALPGAVFFVSETGTLAGTQGRTRSALTTLEDMRRVHVVTQAELLKLIAKA